MPISKVVRIATWSAGAEYPAQLPAIGTPYGRGRASSRLMKNPASLTKPRLHRNTSRCRQRRNAIVSATADSPIIVAPQPEPATSIPLARPVSHGVRVRAANRSAAVLA